MGRCISIAKVVIVFAVIYPVFSGILALAAYKEYFHMCFEDFRFYVLIAANIGLSVNILLSVSLYFVLKEAYAKQEQDIDEESMKKLPIQQQQPSIYPGLPDHLPSAPPYSDVSNQGAFGTYSPLPNCRSKPNKRRGKF